MLCQDIKTLIIVNKKPIKNLKYVLTSDKQIVNEAKKEELRKRMQYQFYVKG